MFVYELEIYKNENINITNIDYKDNKNLLNLFIDKTTGIFTLINEQALLGGRGSDNAVLAGLTKAHGRSGKDKPGHENYGLPKVGNNSFLVKHYAGEVEYQISELLIKNNDSIHQDLKILTNDSINLFVTKLMGKYQDRRNGGGGSGGGRKSKGEEEKPATATATATATTTKKVLNRTESTQLLGSTTIGQRVKMQMETLSTIIRACTPHFVRCIKPNHVALPAPSFDTMLVVKQLRFLGLMETCRIRRQGYPIRTTFASLVLRYTPIVPLPLGPRHAWIEYKRKDDGASYFHNSETGVTTWEQPDENVNISKEDTQRDMCARLLTKYISTSNTMDWQLGTTKVFLKDQKLEMLDTALAAYYDNVENLKKESNAKIMQRGIRLYLARKELRRRKMEYVKEEARVRKLAAEAEAKRLADERAAADENERRRLKATIKLQAIARGHAAKKEGFLKQQLKARKDAAAKLQSLHRMRSQQKIFQEQKDVTTKIQGLIRMRSRRASMDIKKKAMIKIQSSARMRNARYQHQLLLKSCILVQKHYRGFRTRNKVSMVQDAREEWKQYLSPNEAVLFASLVRKEAGGGMAKIFGFKKRRQLLMTSRPRFLYVDPNDGTIKGDIDMALESVVVELASDLEKEEQKSNPNYQISKKDITQDFRITTPTRVYVFTDLLGFAQQWKKTAVDYERHRAAVNSSRRRLAPVMAPAEKNDKIPVKYSGKKKEGGGAEASSRQVMPMFVGVGDMVKRGFDIQHSVLLQGYLTKQSIKGRFGKKWTKRWMVLHGHTLYWFKSEYVFLFFLFFFVFFVFLFSFCNKN